MILVITYLLYIIQIDGGCKERKPCEFSNIIESRKLMVNL